MWNELSSYQRPRLWPLLAMMKKQVTMWIVHQKVRIAATAFACRSVSPIFSPSDFAHILHHLPMESHQRGPGEEPMDLAYIPGVLVKVDGKGIGRFGGHGFTILHSGWFSDLTR